MAGFTKLWCDIIASSVWSEDDKTRIVWITILALSDAGGHVRAALPGLADLARVKLEDCKNAVHKLESPDPYSRDKEFEGRRIEPEPGGWIILNYVKSRNRLGRDVNPEHRATYQREWQRRRRESLAKTVNKVSTGMSTDCQPSASASVYNNASDISKRKRRSKRETFSEAYAGIKTITQSGATMPQGAQDDRIGDTFQLPGSDNVS